MKELTETQLKIFNYIKDHISEAGFPPTQKEIQLHFGYKSLNSATLFLEILQQKGLITILPGKARGIRLVSEQKADVGKLKQALSIIRAWATNDALEPDFVIELCDEVLSA